MPGKTQDTGRGEPLAVTRTEALVKEDLARGSGASEDLLISEGHASQSFMALVKTVEKRKEGRVLGCPPTASPYTKRHKDMLFCVHMCVVCEHWYMHIICVCLCVGIRS